MLYTAYLDEADTHGPAPTIIMAGVLGTTRQWVIFSRRLHRLQSSYGFSIFHTSEFKSRRGEFRGWSNAKRYKLVEELTELVRDSLTEGLTTHLEHKRYQTEYRASPVPRRMHLDSQYGLCFRGCLRHLIEIVLADGKRHRLHVVIEDGHKNAGDTRRIFDEVKRWLKEQRGIDLLGDLIVADKRDREPLMLADFLASSYSEMRATKQAGGIDYVAVTKEPPKGQAGLTFLEFLPNALAQMKVDFEMDRQDRAEAWRARRKANRADTSIAR